MAIWSGSDINIRKVIDRGPDHPVVARLTMQVFELTKAWNVEKATKDELHKLCFDLVKRLLRCEEIIVTLKNKAAKTIAESNEINEQNGGAAVSVPHIVTLNSDVETFLYEVKNYLRETLKIINIMYGGSFRNAGSFVRGNMDDRESVVEWSEREFGEDDKLTRLLKDDREWIEEIMQKRNAAEHPGGRSGTLHIHNFEVDGRGNLIPLIWHRDDMQKTGLFNDAETILDNLLSFTEDLILLGIKRNMTAALVFNEIPEDQRDPETPIRFKLALDLACVADNSEDGIGDSPSEPPTNS
jgi:hypothetical protein